MRSNPGAAELDADELSALAFERTRLRALVGVKANETLRSRGVAVVTEARRRGPCCRMTDP